MTLLETLQTQLNKIIKPEELKHLYIFDDPIQYLYIKTIYNESLTFYENGKVKCHNIVLSSGHLKPGHCRFLLDIIESKSNIVINNWNDEEKSGYFYITEEGE